MPSKSKQLSTSGDPFCEKPAQYFSKFNALGDIAKCPDLKEFLDSVPVDSVSLVYASENLVSSASMMGHVFIKLSGLRADSKIVSHSVSFFTDVEEVSIPALFYESMVTGRQGILALSPFSKIYQQYVVEEQRNLWEYQISLTKDQKKLIQLHLWELKNATLPYFFDRYNCATLVHNILRVGRPEIQTSNINKVSPLDVVKAVEAAGVVHSRQVILAPKWRIRMLSSELPSDLLNSLEFDDPVTASVIPETFAEKFLLSQLVESYVDYRVLQHSISKEHENMLLNYADSLVSGYEKQVVDLSKFKSPSKLPNDTQWMFGWQHKFDDSSLKLTYLPAGLRKEDDSRQYFSNNELRLFETSILVDNEAQTVDLDELTLYSVSAIKPYNTLVGGYSGKFEFAIQDHVDRYFNRHKVLDIEGGIGIASDVARDVNVYTMGSAGLAFGRGEGAFHNSLEAGFISNLVFDMKLIGVAKRTWGTLRSKGHYDEYEFLLSKYHGKSLSFVAEWRYLQGSERSDVGFGFGVKYLY